MSNVEAGMSKGVTTLMGFRSLSLSGSGKTGTGVIVWLSTLVSRLSTSSVA